MNEGLTMSLKDRELLENIHDMLKILNEEISISNSFKTIMEVRLIELKESIDKLNK